MKIGVIDIGSNSVRLMLWADGKTLYKKMCTTRLGEGLANAPVLNAEAVERTARAVADFKNLAECDGAERVYAFATAAVRTAQNSSLFLERARALCGLDIDVLSGQAEAEAGLSGALKDGDGGLIDVGGASTEVTLRLSGKIVYSQSVDIGTVRILNSAGRDLERINAFIAQFLPRYGAFKFPKGAKCYAVGGTATRLASIKHGFKEYLPLQIDGTPLSLEEVRAFAVRLTLEDVEKIRQTTICKQSADLIGGAAALLCAVMNQFGVKSVTVSDGDNLEGYLLNRISAEGL